MNENLNENTVTSPAAPEQPSAPAPASEPAFPESDKAGLAPDKAGFEPKDAEPLKAEAPAASPVQPESPQPENPLPEAPWAKPMPQLTLDPDPAAVDFNSPPPPRAPEPPAPYSSAETHSGTEPQPTVQNQYVYNFNTSPSPDQNASQSGQNPYGQPYAGYQPPNYTAQSYRPQPQRQPMYTTPPAGYQQKSRLAAGLLAILLGALGIHNYYLGFNTRGTIQLVLCLAGGLLTCGLGTVAAAVWGFIEGVMLLSSSGPRFDGNGVILKE